MNAADKTQRIPNTTFEIRRVSDGGLVDTVTTGTDGRVYVPLESGSYYAVETEAGKGFQLDNTPIYFAVEDGKTTTKTVTNKAISGILIHKVDAITGEGIPGVSFILYDSGNDPIAQETSDDRGYVRFENLTAGRFYLREFENEGYIPDTQKKTVYVKSGETTEIEWKNTPITGQIQIIKKSADDNATNGLPAVPLAHAFGRIGCFFAGCCYGIPYDPPIGICLKNAIGTAPTDIPLFPVQLLESGLDFLLAGLLQLCFRKRTRKTDVIPFYCIGYAGIRLFTERFRYDTERGIYFGLATSEWISLALAICGVLLLLVPSLRRKRASHS